VNNIQYVPDSYARRRLLASSAALPALAWAGAIQAQTREKIRRIGLLSNTSPSDTYPAFRQALRDLGWIEGKHYTIEYRYAERKPERFPKLAAELVRLKVDLIVAPSSSGAGAARRTTSAIPIVMTFIGDPVAAGMVESMSRPGGNVTGLSQMSSELVGKRMELLKEMIPKLTRLAVLWYPPVRVARYWEGLKISAQKLGVELHSMDVLNASEFDQVFENAVKVRADALFIIPALLFNATTWDRIANLAIQSRLPSIFDFSYFPDHGGLMSYGTNPVLDMRAAVFVDKILRGAKPADLPIEQPTKFELVINLKTAKALGLTVPQSILVRADRVIE
jgi:putative tryptophan/tyrosine transport system substrate-binding protein